MADLNPTEESCFDPHGLTREAKRVHHRYMVEFVEAFQLCPWAERARREGHVATQVGLEASWEEPREESESVSTALDLVEKLAADTVVDVGFVIFPRLALSRTAFGRFVSALRKRHEKDSPPDVRMAMAAFHPCATPDFTEPHRLIHYMRCTPDPTIQLVRVHILDSMRQQANSAGTQCVDLSQLNPSQMKHLLKPAAHPPLHERVAEDNLETMRRCFKEADAVLKDIHADRAKSYPRPPETLLT